jgi:glycosyltransferase involved in cell wall biosynthesis
VDRGPAISYKSGRRIMKIALVDPSLFSVPYDQELFLALQKRGHDLRWFGRRVRPDELDYGQDHLFEDAFYSFSESGFCRRLPRPFRLAAKGLDHAFSMRRFVREMRRWRPDVIHFQWVPLPSVDRRFLKALREVAPLVVTVHDSLPFNASPSSFVQTIGVGSIYAGFDRLIVHTADAVTKLVEAGHSPDSVACIPHGILPATGDAAEMGEVPSPDEDVLLLVQFGVIKPYKGVDVLVRAMAAMPAEARGRCRALIAGKPAIAMGPLESLVDSLAVGDHVEFDLRFFTAAEMHALFGRASAMVFPYRCIDASGVLFSCLRAGRPIVASDLGMFREMLVDGVHGYLVPPEDPPALADALTRLVGDEAGRRRMGESVRALLDEVPGWDEIAERTEGVYEGAVGPRPGAVAPTGTETTT